MLNQRIQGVVAGDPLLLIEMNTPAEATAGVDEVGRGCLFGPVFAGAVVLSESAAAALLDQGLTDSKALTPKHRQRLVPLIKSLAIDWSLGQASAREIDAVGIRSATEMAMFRALQRIDPPLELVLVDGVLPLRLWLGAQRTVVRGDAHCAAIAAASVLAKQARDHLIKRLANRFPGYGLESHVGYGTPQHRKALLRSGSTPLHRQSFLTKILAVAGVD